MEHIIGIDVAKDELVIFCNGNNFSIKNNSTAIKKWFNNQKKNNISIKLVVFEPTGGYERLLAFYLEDNQLPYRMVHANHVRAFAKAKGILAKTDNIDAEVLASFAKTMELEPKSCIHPYPKLKDILDRRDQLVEMRVQESNRLETLQDKYVKSSIDKHIRYMTKQIDAIEQEANKIIKDNEELQLMVELYQSIPGIGLLTAMRLLVDLPELCTHDDKQIAALVGVAPMNQDSGNHRGKRKIKAGRPRVRSILYLAVLTGIRYNPVLKQFYQRLRAKGKNGKVAVVASIRKMLTILRSVAQRKSPWVVDF